MEQKKQENALPPSQPHTISYPESYRETFGESGAVYFAGKVDRPKSRYYVFNDYFNMESDETLHILTHFKTYQQTTEYTCGAASALMVLHWFGAEKYHEMAVSSLTDSHTAYGTSVENMADFFDLIGWETDFHAKTEKRFASVDEFREFVIDHIDRGIPILVNWVDWAGHWQAVIGIDTCGTETPYDDVLIFADPYDITDHCQDGYFTFSLGRFYEMWQEGACAEKTEPYIQPFVVACPKPQASEK